MNREGLTESLGRLLGYLRTWQGPDNGLFGGMIATWWSSTVETAVAHPMNQYPVILGLLELHRAGVGGGEWLVEATRIGDGLVGSMGPDDMLANCWGDIPGKGTGTVIFAGPALALAELAKDSKEARYLEAAQALLDVIDVRWSIRGQNSDGVANQGLKWAEAMDAVGRIRRDTEIRERARWLATKVLSQQIKNGSEKGAFHQGRSDDRLITVYVGKCLTSLAKLYEYTGDRRLLDAAMEAAVYVSRQSAEGGLFLNYKEGVGPIYNVINRLPRFDRLIFRRAIPTYRLWRSVITEWRTTVYPSFIARAADTIRGLWLLGRDNADIRRDAEGFIQRFLQFQLPHGGFRNAVGFRGEPSEVSWQDVCCPTRWNAYAFLLLAQVVADLGGQCGVREFPCDEAFECPIGGPGRLVFREMSGSVEIADGDEAIVSIRKPEGVAVHVAPAWRGDLTGERSSQNMAVQRKDQQ